MSENLKALRKAIVHRVESQAALIAYCGNNIGGSKRVREAAIATAELDAALAAVEQELAALQAERDELRKKIADWRYVVPDDYIHIVFGRKE